MLHLVVIERRICSGHSSPDSQWRRSISVSTSQKSDRSFIDAFLPDLLNVIYRIFLYLSNFSEDGQ